MSLVLPSAQSLVPSAFFLMPTKSPSPMPLWLLKLKEYRGYIVPIGFVLMMAVLLVVAHIARQILDGRFLGLHRRLLRWLFISGLHVQRGLGRRQHQLLFPGNQIIDAQQ